MSTQNTELKVNELRREDRSEQAGTPIEQLADLQINDWQAAEVKGGPLLFTAVVTQNGTKDVMGLPPHS